MTDVTTYLSLSIPSGEGKVGDEGKVLGRESLALQCEIGGFIVVAIDLLRFSQG
jgi:hypothetical protein